MSIFESLKKGLEQAIAYESGETTEAKAVPVIRVIEGQKLWMPNKESSYELEKKLNALGIKTRVGRNCEIDLWSIYIISVPDNLVNTYQEI